MYFFIFQQGGGGYPPFSTEWGAQNPQLPGGNPGHA